MSKFHTFNFGPNYICINNFAILLSQSEELVIWEIDVDSPVCSPRVPPGSSGSEDLRILTKFCGNSIKIWKSNMADRRISRLTRRDLCAAKRRSKLNLFFVKSQ